MSKESEIRVGATSPHRFVVHVEDERNEPVADAAVSLVAQHDSERLARAITDKGGRAVLFAPFPGPCWAEAARGEDFGRCWNVMADQEVTIRLSAHRLTRFLVLDSIDTPMEGAQVRVEQGGAYVGWGTTDALGLTADCLLPLNGHMKAHVRGAEIEDTAVAFECAEVTGPVTLRVVRSPHEVTGIVLSGSRPVSGARVRDLERGGRVSVTAEDGTFRLGTYSSGASVLLLAECTGLGWTTESVTIREGPEHVALELPEGWELVVLALDQEGRPIPSVEVTGTVHTAWARAVSEAPAEIAVRQAGRTDESGRCTLRGMLGNQVEVEAVHALYNRVFERVEGRQVTLRMSGRTDWTWTLDLLPEVEGFVGRENWNLTLTPASTLDAEGRHIVPDLRWSGRTDRSGRAILHQIPTGPYHAQVSSPGSAWTEDLDLVVSGSMGAFAGPSVVARIGPSPPEVESVIVSGRGFRSIAWTVKGGWACLSHPGPVELSVGGRRRSVTVPDIGGEVWLDP